MEMLREFKIDQLQVEIYADRTDMGKAAAGDIAKCLRETLTHRDKARIVFAAAVSQNEMLAALAQESGIDWSRVEAFHMDEYVGLADDAPQRFGTYLKEHIFALVSPGRIEYLNGSVTDPQREVDRYARLLAKEPIDIVCAGIGENGHMAFNDPHVAKFDDPFAVKLVELDPVCRMQQVHDGAFESLVQVPQMAITLTMPTLMSSHHIFCVVPGTTKASAIESTLHEEINISCPATAMRGHPHATLYLDRESAALIGQR